MQLNEYNRPFWDGQKFIDLSPIVETMGYVQVSLPETNTIVILYELIVLYI